VILKVRKDKLKNLIKLNYKWTPYKIIDIKNYIGFHYISHKSHKYQMLNINLDLFK